MKLPTINWKHALQKIPSVISGYFLEHQGAVLTGGTIVCNAAGIAVTYRNSPEIHRIISTARELLSDPDLTEEKKEVICRSTMAAIVPLVIPIILFFFGSTTCAIVNQKKNEAKIATLTAALTMAQNTISEYDLFKEEVKKDVGEERYKEIQQEVASKSVESAITSRIPQPKPGEKLFYLSNLGVFFSAEGKEHVECIMRNIEGILRRNGVAGESYGNVTHRGNEIVTYADICSDLSVDVGDIPEIAERLYFESGHPFNWVIGHADKYGESIYALLITSDPTNVV